MGEHRIDDGFELDELVDRVLASDYRRYIYAGAPVVVGLLTTFGFDEAAVGLWVAAVAGILVAVLAFLNSASTWRRGLYSLVILAQPLLVFYGLDQNRVGAFVAFLVTALGFGVAAAWTPTLPVAALTVVHDAVESAATTISAAVLPGVPASLAAEAQRVIAEAVAASRRNLP